MADARSNVLHFDDHKRLEKATREADSEALLSACRDHLSLGVATAFAEGLGACQDRLLTAAERARDAKVRNCCFDAQGLISRRNQELLQTFDAELTRIHTELLSTHSKGRACDDTPAHDIPDELSLVDEAEFERDLTVNKLAARAAYNCLHELMVLTKRVAYLLHAPHLNQEENPFHPRVVYGAMVNAASALTHSNDVAIVLLAEFEHQVGRRLPSLYGGLNRYLVKQGILPQLSTGKTHDALSAKGVAASVTRAASSDREVAPIETDILAAFTQQMQARPHGPGQSAHGGTAQHAGGQGHGPSLPVSQILDVLSRLQQGVIDPLLQSAIPSQDEGLHADDLLDRIRATPLGQCEDPKDRAAIEVLAKLFTMILQEPNMPSTLRDELVRLQIPVLKAALLDKTFFSDKEHPARRLIDNIAGAGIGWSNKEQPRLVEMVRSVVGSLEQGFDTNIDLFDEEAKKLEDFLHEEERKAQERAQKLSESLLQRDKEEMSKSLAAEAVKRRLGTREYPSLIVDFVDKIWRLWLMRVYIDGGDESAAWQDALATLDDLMWSVTPKTSAEEGERLLELIPDLRQRLQIGFAGLGIAADQEKEFAHRLRRIQINTLRAASRRDDTTRSVSMTTPTSMLSDRTRTTMTPGSNLNTPSTIADAQGKRLVLGDPDTRFGQSDGTASAMGDTTSETSDSYLQLAQDLRVGSWIEFTSPRGIKRSLRLAWVSGFRGIYLFTNRQGQDALSLPTSRLAARLREGSARVLSGDNATDRAVNRLLEETRRARGAAH